MKLPKHWQGLSEWVIRMNEYELNLSAKQGSYYVPIPKMQPVRH